MRDSGKRLPGILLACIGSMAIAGASAQDAAEPTYLDPSLPPQERAADLVQRMTLEEKASQLVNSARAIPRLGVPAYDWWSEALHGVHDGRDDGVSGADRSRRDVRHPRHSRRWRPTSGSRAASCTTKAVRAGGSTIFHGLDFWAPNVNIFRDPRWGRGQETYGEDPFLTGRHGGGVRYRHAGIESALLPGDRYAQALRRA